MRFFRIFVVAIEIIELLSKKIMMKHLRHYIAVMAVAALTACSGKGEWTVSGTVDGAEGQTMVLEASTNGRWYPLDSVKLPASGDFKISHKAMGYPDIYRLRLDGKSVYFPIDSIESVKVVANANAFDVDYTISGSPAADMLMDVDRKVMKAAAERGASSLQADTALKRELGKLMLSDPAGIVSYYIVNKKVGGVALYNPSDKFDNRVIGAVANAFSTIRPNDPRTEFLKAVFLTNRPRTTVTADTLAANELPIIEIDLYDNTGAEQSLQKVAQDNKVVVLNFTVYGAEASPAFNAELNKVYERYHNSGLEIYQIGFDDNEYQWRQAAKNLPWITVYNSSTDGVENLLHYNVSSLPATFIIANGELVERVADVNSISSRVAKHF